MAYKIVYYGPGMSGKTTNLQWISRHAPIDIHEPLHPVLLADERALTITLKEYHQSTMHTVYWELWTLPGAQLHAHARNVVLHGVHGIVFVASSLRNQLQENIKSMQELFRILHQQGRGIATIPLVLQYNKRDTASPLPAKIMHTYLNIMQWRTCEAEAINGIGVLETLSMIGQLVARD